MHLLASGVSGHSNSFRERRASGILVDSILNLLELISQRIKCWHGVKLFDYFHGMVEVVLFGKCTSDIQ